MLWIIPPLQSQRMSPKSRTVTRDDSTTIPSLVTEDRWSGTLIRRLLYDVKSLLLRTNSLRMLSLNFCSHNDTSFCVKLHHFGAAWHGHMQTSAVLLISLWKWNFMYFKSMYNFFSFLNLFRYFLTWALMMY